jgi:hypothetical protein
MPSIANTRSDSRDSVSRLDRESVSVLSGLITLIRSIPSKEIYRSSTGAIEGSVGSYVVKSAGTLERTFGGLTTNLWDDPFEWTLPETLSTTTLILEYLAEVDGARIRAFASLVDDSALSKYIAVPSGEQATIHDLLGNALETARRYHARAAETAKMLFADNAPGFII